MCVSCDSKHIEWLSARMNGREEDRNDMCYTVPPSRCAYKQTLLFSFKVWPAIFSFGLCYTKFVLQIVTNER